ncbi:uncharacterized protein [Nicotiana sylvestris]|uniref:uncharacterized protein n=1 Tax=Nicotiana sylvestris TaxID=4096 RepID=UPI00388CBBBE
MDIKPPQDPTVGNKAMILVPALRRNPILGAVRENGEPQNQKLNVSMNRPTNIIIWNIRGGNNENFRRIFREMVDAHRPCMLALLETIMGSHVELLNDFGFMEIIEVLADGQAGGIVILYNHEVVTIQNFIHRNQEIHATIEVLPIRKLWLFSTIYASTDICNRNTMWENLKNISRNHIGPWMVGGDFNDIFSANDKFGGRPLNDSRAKFLWSKLNSCKLIDLGFKECKYIWSSHRHKNKGLIMERLDKSKEIKREKSSVVNAGQLPY